MTSAFSVMPFFRPSLQLERMNELFDSMLRDQDSTPGYPAYNIERRDDDHYVIALAVPGFADKDLSITVERDRVIVTGQVPAQAEGVEYLYQGIGVRAFERTFRLGSYMKVAGAELKDGLLRIQLVREVPEEAKPRPIPINAGNGTKVIEATAEPGKN